jgi:hypothetical protein
MVPVRSHIPPSMTTSDPAMNPMPPCLLESMTAINSPICSGVANLVDCQHGVTLMCWSNERHSLANGRPSLPVSDPLLGGLVGWIGDHVGQDVALWISICGGKPK